MFKFLIQLCLVCACIIALLTYERLQEMQIMTSKGPIALKLELANTPITRNLGLMWRKNLSEYEGMFFAYEQETPLSFWMKNTIIPLDIIFLDASYKIIKIHKNAKPYDLTGINSEKPSQYVIELASGSADKFSINEGDMVVITH